MAMVVLTEPVLGLQASSQGILSYGTIVYGQPSKVVFRETCDTWNATKWSYYGNRPDVVNGTWVFEWPASTEKFIQANYITPIGWGSFKMRFKMSGPRVSSIHYWIFLYQGPDYTARHNELDFWECYGERPYPSEFVVTFWRNGTGGGQAGNGGITYWYSTWINSEPTRFATTFPNYVDWEDGNWHTLDINYTSVGLDMWVDGLKIFHHVEGQAGRDVQPLPPMQFMIGGSGTAASYFSWTIDQIEYYSMG